MNQVSHDMDLYALELERQKAAYRLQKEEQFKKEAEEILEAEERKKRYAKDKFNLEMRRRRERWRDEREKEAAARITLLQRREQEAKDRLDKLILTITQEIQAIKNKIEVTVEYAVRF